ncbi:MAG: DNA-binding protein [Candidatus Acidiferrales bacterium]
MKVTKVTAEGASDLPVGLAKPALRALAGAGYTRLEQLAKVSEDEVMRLHGMGPKALDLLRRALAAKGLSFCRPSRSDGDHRGDEQRPRGRAPRTTHWLDII